ncbi:hypothetical protein [Streptomyces anulatus]|uniref:hypothetical protein n=1 Tax=Streptomyces anulatus TaxID=1892 RepID=UPI002ED067AE|nr:hypothetical protein OG703_33775 [Streptomyces anulatus]
MALPDDLPIVTLTGTYTHPDGSPMKGSVSVSPTPGKVVSASTGLTIQGRAKAKFDGNGQVTLTVLATDAPGINPEGFTYQVTIAFPDATGDSFHIELPAAAPNVRLPAITPAAPSDGDYVVVTGPEGPAGPTGPAGDDGAPGEPGPPGADGNNADAEQYTDNALTAEVQRADAASSTGPSPRRPPRPTAGSASPPGRRSNRPKRVRPSGWSPSTVTSPGASTGQ